MPAVMQLFVQAKAAIGRSLDPADAFAEILFGLIMALTFTLGASFIVDVSNAHDLVYGVVACNVAWGLIDGVFYILAELFKLGRKGLQIRQVQMARTTDDAMKRIREIFDERVVPITTPDERDRIYGALHQLVMRMVVPEKRPTKDGLIAASIIVVLVPATSLPVVLPSLLLRDGVLALQIGNFLLVLCLFVTGYAMARAAGGRGVRFGLIMAALALVLVGIAKALGG
jgi:hypothetical protein